MKYPLGFYVYMLVDPITGVPFYIGKGQRRRAWQHAAAVARGDLGGNTRKVAKIREILTRGDEVEIQIVAEYDLEDGALEHEFELVDSMPTLTNAVPGGGGGPGGRRLTASEIAKRVKARADRVAVRKALAAGRHRARENKARDWYQGMARSAPQATEIKEWLGPANGALVLDRRNEVVVRGTHQGGNKAARARRTERELFLLQTGKIVEVVLPSGQTRLQSVS